MPSSRPFSLRRKCSSFPSSVVALAVALPSWPHTPTRVNTPRPPVPPPETPPLPELPPVPAPDRPPVPPLAPPLPEPFGFELPPEQAHPPASARSTHEVINRRRIDLTTSFFIWDRRRSERRGRRSARCGRPSC